MNAGAITAVDHIDLSSEAPDEQSAACDDCGQTIVVRFREPGEARAHCPCGLITTWSGPETWDAPYAVCECGEGMTKDEWDGVVDFAACRCDGFGGILELASLVA